MVISASRRTDIPAFYSDWFFNRIRERSVLVRNPMRPNQVSRVSLAPDIVDCIVFWTKNPTPMLPRLGELDEYAYYFHFTLNPYDRQIEPAVPRKAGIIDTFKKLSDNIGPERVIWRFDPVIITDGMDIGYHMDSFEAIAKRLSGYTHRCMLGFIDMYRKTSRNMTGTTARELAKDEIITFAEKIAPIARQYDIELQSCSDDTDLMQFGITKGRCIDPALIESVSGYAIDTRKDKNQRGICRCTESIDIGEYDSCPHLCLYCYANNNELAVKRKLVAHDPASPLLIGDLRPDDIISDRKVYSLRCNRLL